MDTTQVQYPDYAFITRGDRSDVVAGRTDDLLVACPECGKKDDIAFLASSDVTVAQDVDMRDVVAWCPCGCVFVIDKTESKRLYSFFKHQ
ncbi:hypothetical protein LCGC14_1340370 [marine sediment metagenome]|uniref:Uncharacterized protein n=1 Tax=marine sediment metagenome TaxID=412755 RepID=A0A0F9L0A0_9ZZZZ